MENLTQVIYLGESATSEWLKHLSGQPGEVWIEVRGSELVVVHEFVDLRKDS